MRRLFLLFPGIILSAAAAFSQPFSFGIKGGMPLTDFIDVARAQNINASSTTNRYVIGGTAELRLPFGLGVEADILYRHFSYGSTVNLANSIRTADTSAGAWEFPLLAKYRFKGGLVRPFINGGVAWDKLSGVTQTVTAIVNNVANTTTTNNPFELRDDTTRGFVLGGGADIKILLIHVLPEVRFTRWGAKHFIDSGVLNSNQTQAEFLIGLTF